MRLWLKYNEVLQNENFCFVKVEEVHECKEIRQSFRYSDVWLDVKPVQIGTKIDLLACMPLKPIHFRQNKKHFHITLDYQASSVVKELDWLFVQKVVATYSREFDLEIQALVMMDTHVHLIVAGVSNKENFFTESMQAALGLVEDNSSGCEVIDNLSQYLNTYKYVYRNPVEARVCLFVEDYKYSSLNALIGKSHLGILIYDQMGVIQNPFHILNWLNSWGDYKHSRLEWLENRN